MTAPTVRRLLSCALLLVLAGCGRSLAVKVETAVPVLMVDAIALRVGVVYNDAFRNHVYSENSEQRPGWSIETGASQVAVFDQVLSSLFTEVKPLTSPNASAAVDLLVMPKIVEMQFATPQETGFDFYEAWIQYDVVLTTPQLDPVSELSLSAYGKAEPERLAGRAAAIDGAVQQALRDAGAKLNIAIAGDPDLARWRESRGQ